MRKSRVRKFENRVAIVTGSAQGIGRAHCEAFAAHGAQVVVADIDEALAAATSESICRKGGSAIHVAVNVADENSVRSMYDTVVRRFQRVDFLVNNAALLLDVPIPFKPFWETAYEEWRTVMDINAGGVFLCCKHVKPIMEKLGGGRIVNISSDAIYKGYENQLAYFASKGAVAVMTRNLARELGPFNINVNNVAPGYTLSESNRRSEFMRKVEPAIMQSCCIKRSQFPSDVSGAVLFLCDEESACITGQSIVVNCGAIMP